MELQKPDDMFDRDWEWGQLAQFASDDQPGASLGLVSGRRRQGKTFLLDALCESTGGFHFEATEALPRSEALRQLGAAVGEFTGAPGSLRFDNWEEAVGALVSLGAERRIPVVVDEFPYLAREVKELPSLIQNALSPRSSLRRGSKARLLLCGSSVSFMGNLLIGGAPLRGRAALELVVPTFNFRLAASFWGITDPKLAALVYFVVGGTPAYLTEYRRGAAPEDLSRFDQWVVEHVLNPASPLFREVRSLLAEEPTLRDSGLYSTVLAAVAEGNATRGGIASRIERKGSDISHHLTVLEDAGMLVSEPDAFRKNRSQYRITEPLVRFHHVIIRPHWAQLERVRPGRTEHIWSAARSTFLAQVAGPVFERMCRVWSEDMAAEATLGGLATKVLSGTVYDARSRSSYEVDVAAFAPGGELLAIGEVKWGEVLGVRHLERLVHIADLLAERGPRPAVLALFSGAGFKPALRERAEQSGGTIQLIDLDRLYTGE